MKDKMLKERNAQSLLEYVLVVGIVVMVASVLFIMIKRGQQSLIKIVADQIGGQAKAEQDLTMENSYLISSNSRSYGLVNDTTSEYGHVMANGTDHFLVSREYDQSTWTEATESSHGDWDRQ